MASYRPKDQQIAHLTNNNKKVSLYCYIEPSAVFVILNILVILILAYTIFVYALLVYL